MFASAPTIAFAESAKSVLDSESIQPDLSTPAMKQARGACHELAEGDG
jgi:hypothetical protein